MYLAIRVVTAFPVTESDASKHWALSYNCSVEASTTSYLLYHPPLFTSILQVSLSLSLCQVPTKHACKHNRPNDVILPKQRAILKETTSRQNSYKAHTASGVFMRLRRLVELHVNENRQR